MNIDQIIIGFVSLGMPRKQNVISMRHLGSNGIEESDKEIK
jgi:hypothetical protein